MLPIFDYIAKKGNIPVRDMFNTFNMGVGMTVCVAPEDADKTIDLLTQAGETAYRLASWWKETVRFCWDEKDCSVSQRRGGTNLQALIDAQHRGEIPGGESPA